MWLLVGAVFRRFESLYRMADLSESGRLRSRLCSARLLHKQAERSSDHVMFLDPRRMSSEQIYLTVGDGRIIARGCQHGFSKMLERECSLDAFLFAALDERVIDRIDMSAPSEIS